MNNYLKDEKQTRWRGDESEELKGIKPYWLSKITSSNEGYEAFARSSKWHYKTVQNYKTKCLKNTS